MKVIYDAETDTLSLVFKEETILESDETKDGLILDYGADGKIVSIEILDASVNITEPQSIAYEIKGKQKVS